jgi:hypothetical protein
MVHLPIWKLIWYRFCFDFEDGEGGLIAGGECGANGKFYASRGEASEAGTLASLSVSMTSRSRSVLIICNLIGTTNNNL